MSNRSVMEAILFSLDGHLGISVMSRTNNKVVITRSGLYSHTFICQWMGVEEKEHLAVYLHKGNMSNHYPFMSLYDGVQMAEFIGVVKSMMTLRQKRHVG